MPGRTVVHMAVDHSQSLEGIFNARMTQEDGGCDRLLRRHLLRASLKQPASLQCSAACRSHPIEDIIRLIRDLPLCAD